MYDNSIHKVKVYTKMQTSQDEKTTLSHLKFITKFKQGKRVDLRNYIMVDESIVNTLMRRFIYRDSRWNTLKFIEKTVMASFCIAEKYSRQDSVADKILVTHIIEDIIATIRGIDNICVTYKGDNKFVSDLQIIRNSIAPMISDFKIALGTKLSPGDMLCIFLEVDKLCKSTEIEGIVYSSVNNSAPPVEQVSSSHTGIGVKKR